MIKLGLSGEDNQRLIGICKRAVQHFGAGDWQTLGVQTGEMDFIVDHPRLLRSLNWGDPDYSGAAHAVLYELVDRNRLNLGIIEKYIGETYGEEGENISTAPSHSRPITFTPSVFEVPNSGVESDLVAVMIPFSKEFEVVFEAISGAACANQFRAVRAKDIWQHTAVIQDVFSLIYKAQIVVCDFTRRNPNVLYEAGIAHTLGKHVIPITQTADDIPFDLQHHRYQTYLNNKEGLSDLTEALSKRLITIRG